MKKILFVLIIFVLMAMYFRPKMSAGAVSYPGNTPTNAPDTDETSIPYSTRTPWPTLEPRPYPLPTQDIEPYPQPESAEVVRDTCTITTGKSNGLANLRRCASKICNVITILHEGDNVTILDNGSWVHVLTKDEVTGYVASNLCK